MNTCITKENFNWLFLKSKIYKIKLILKVKIYQKLILNPLYKNLIEI